MTSYQVFMIIFAICVVFLMLVWAIKDTVWEMRFYRDRVRDDADTDIKAARSIQYYAEKRLQSYINIEKYKPIMTLQIPQWSEGWEACEDCPLASSDLCGDDHQESPCMEGGEYGLFLMPERNPHHAQR